MFSPVISAFTILALAASSLAAPHRSRVFGSRVQIERIQQFNVPLTNGSATLPDFGQLKTKAITIGRGTQNYTCASSTAADKPVAIGAVATLYNAAAFLPRGADKQRGDLILAEMPDFLLHASRSTLDGFLPIQGQHFFSEKTPVFDLRSTNSGIMFGKLEAQIDAPKTSVQGQNGVIPWLALAAVAGSEGVSFGYRTVTAGGKPPTTCEGLKSAFEVEYAAQYFFYD